MEKKTFHSYYELLQVAPNASTEEIHAAYRTLVKRFHPDRNPKNKMVAQQRLYLINEAYAQLKRPDGRRQYDLRLTSGKKLRVTRANNDNKKEVRLFPWAEVAKVGWTNLSEILWPIAPRPKNEALKLAREKDK